MQCCHCCCRGRNSLALALPASAGASLPASITDDLVLWYKFTEPAKVAVTGDKIINYSSHGSARNASFIGDHTTGSATWTGAGLFFDYVGNQSSQIYPGFRVDSQFVLMGDVVGGNGNKGTVMSVVEIDSDMPASVDRNIWFAGQGANAFKIGYQRAGNDSNRSFITAYAATAIVHSRVYDLISNYPTAGFLSQNWLVNFTVRGTSAGDNMFRINQVEIDPLNLDPAGDFGTKNPDDWNVGRNLQGNGFRGTLYYMMIFNRDLTLAEQIQVEDFIVAEMAKRGISIP